MEKFILQLFKNTWPVSAFFLLFFVIKMIKSWPVYKHCLIYGFAALFTSSDSMFS